ncbi:MAG: DUF21 domain-containing protein, partial [Candidatus Cloacimonetes bacterium]|nr:DUF21 domain-containing protein [Candidatus Cloacimonadota bacterium]
YFTRNALKLSALLLPILRVYQIILYPVNRPSAWILDKLLGGEEIRYFKERDLRRLIRLHMEAASTEIDVVEGQGALNFLEIDDVPFREEGELVDPKSIIQIDFKDDRPIFPDIKPSAQDEFLNSINQSGKKWIVIVNSDKEPRLLLKAGDFTREALFQSEKFSPYRHCHRPILVKDEEVKLGQLIRKFTMKQDKSGDDIIENDVILLWGEESRIVTGEDLLGRLLRNIAATSD